MKRSIASSSSDEESERNPNLPLKKRFPRGRTDASASGREADENAGERGADMKKKKRTRGSIKRQNIQFRIWESDIDEKAPEDAAADREAADEKASKKKPVKTSKKKRVKASTKKRGLNCDEEEVKGDGYTSDESGYTSDESYIPGKEKTKRKGKSRKRRRTD